MCLCSSADRSALCTCLRLHVQPHSVPVLLVRICLCNAPKLLQIFVGQQVQLLGSALQCRGTLNRSCLGMFAVTRHCRRHLGDQLFPGFAAITQDYAKSLKPFLAEAEVATVDTASDARRFRHFTRLCHVSWCMLLREHRAVRDRGFSATWWWSRWFR